jgi:hypothetical protein
MVKLFEYSIPLPFSKKDVVRYLNIIFRGLVYLDAIASEKEKGLIIKKHEIRKNENNEIVRETHKIHSGNII